ncbi:CCAAT displacement transcription factor COY1 [Nakaseomyces bracarensis]|uniref:CCAAT displacement transcription factor COY1 n=1 Tax=Nakaseomyces bracarensis TaxID=273131 RepID=UPI003871C72A
MDGSVFKHAAELWSKADLSSLQHDLDNSIIEIKDRESGFLESRKLLASETKSFKKLDSDEKLGTINKLIKQYQQEIDSLTKRSKNSEQALLDVYAKISEAPDPSPLLQSSAERLENVEDSKELQEKITQLEDRLAKYADYDKIKERLLDLEQNSATTLTKRLAAKEQELNSTWEEKQRNWKNKEEELSKQIDTLQTNNKALEATIAKRIDIEGTDDSVEGGQVQYDFSNSAERNLLVQELESSQSRIFQLEKRNEELNGKLAKATSDAEKESELSAKLQLINQLESENALITASIERERKNAETRSKKLQEELGSLKTEATSYKTELDTLRRKLNTYSDYNKIKEQLEALKKIEFGVDDDDDGDEDDIEDNSVQKNLLSANKKLQKSLVEIRTEAMEKSSQNEKLQKDIKSLQIRLRQLEENNAKLELDLQQMEDIDQKFNDTASMISGVTRQMNNRGNRAGKYSPTTSIVGISEEPEGDGSLQNSTILPIVTKQRDRFRSRNSDLEKQLRQINQEKGKITQELQIMKKDNAKLYEKVRYLSSVQTGSTSDFNLDTESQYADSYNESLHPLANFKKSERDYYLNRKLSVWEKLFSTFAKIVLQNKSTRLAFFLYCICLHGLVFMMCMYVINISGYLTPEVNTVTSSEKKFGNPI